MAGASTAPTNPTTDSPSTPSSLEKYVETITARYQRPATIFCSRELEAGLVSYVRSAVASGDGFPSDDAIRHQARRILGTPETAADDAALLGKFKIFVMSQLNQKDNESPRAQGRPTPAPSALPCDMGMDLTDAEMDSILADMSFDMTADVHVPTPGHMA